MNRFSAFATMALLSTALSSTAKADIYDFTLTGSRDASFSIDTSIAPSFFTKSSLIGDQIGYDNVSGIFNGVAGVAADIDFGQAPILADLNIDEVSLGFTQFGGPTLFEETKPELSFATGTFDLPSIVSGLSVLTITDVSTVPEPASWLLLIPGIAALAFASRSKAKNAAAC